MANTTRTRNPLQFTITATYYRREFQLRGLLALIIATYTSCLLKKTVLVSGFCSSKVQCPNLYCANDKKATGNCSGANLLIKDRMRFLDQMMMGLFSNSDENDETELERVPVNERKDLVGNLLLAARDIGYKTKILTMNGEGRKMMNSINIENKYLWIGDMISLAVAFQIASLIDVVNDPLFSVNGGWLQPVRIDPETTTLPILIKRYCSNTILYNFATVVVLKCSAYKTTSVLSTDSLARISLQTGFTFLTIKVFTSLLSTFTQTLTLNNNDEWWNIDMFEIFRDCYYVLLGTSTFRYFMYRYWH